MSSRLDRVNEELREILAEEIPRLKDPRLGFVTVTGVRVTPDLRKARIFYTVLGEEKQHRGTRAALRSASSHLRMVLGREIRLKVTPELEFTEDDAGERGQRIEQILTRIHEEEDERGAEPSG
jgi:ribosome-binding factor A